MRRLSIGLVLVVALLLMLTAIATAAPPFCDPDSPKYDPYSPACSDATTTTTEPTLEACPTEIEIEILKSGPVELECLWTPVEPEVRNTMDGVEGKVTVTPVDGISELLVFVRDDSPGDICLLAQKAETQAVDGSFVGSFDLSYEAPPALHEDWETPYPAIFEYYEHQTYWSFNHFGGDGENGMHWCYPQDGIEGMREDLNGEPLHLLVRFRAKKDFTQISVTLTAEPVVTAGS